jgi:lipooligosaccharide transport system ATP-binding protein
MRAVMTEPVVVAQGLRKSYAGVEAVAGIDLEVPRGACFGMLGPNGAGKTTVTRMVQAVLPRSGGSLQVLGMDPDRSGPELRGKIGVVPQGDNLDPDLDLRGNLTIYARFFGIGKRRAAAKADELLEFAQLTDRAKARPRELSGGMRRRLILARALVNDPELLLLDEPTTALDPQAKHQVWAWLRDLRKAGRTLLLTTHDMEEAERLCDDLVIVDKGQVIERGRPADLVGEHVGVEVLELRGGEIAARQRFAACFPEIHCVQAGTAHTFHLGDADDGRAMASRAFDERLEPRLRPATLEDVFLELTGRELRA